MTWLPITICAVLGVAIGSFLNVLIYRIPRNIPFANDRSKCPKCQAPIAVRDLIPIISWLLLRGKCRNCQEKISIRYPLIEIFTGVLFGLTGARIGAHWFLPAELVFVAALIAISAIDLEYFVIPNRLVYPAGFICLALLISAAVVGGDWHSLRTALISSMGAWLFMLVIHLISPRGMGFGDVRLAALIGLNVGWLSPGRAIFAIFLGFLLGATVGIAMIVFRHASRKSALPFGPFLAAAAVIALFVQYSPLERLLP